MKGIFRFLSGIMGITWLLWGGCRPTIKEHDQSLSDITVIDLNTLEALRECTDIRSISDTIANAPYNKYGFTFIPQQSGRVRELNFDCVTFCYHPNVMDEEAFLELERFLRVHEGEFVPYPKGQSKREEDLRDRLLRRGYFAMRGLRKKLNGK